MQAIKKPVNLDLNICNQELLPLDAKERIEWAYEIFKENFAFTTSFGLQSSVLLHLIQNSKLKSKARIFWIDTGYLPPETYIYANQLIEQLSLKIEVLQSDISPARMEALYGKLWENNEEGDIEKYHKIRKIEPLEKGFSKYEINCWVSGVRAEQTGNRSKMRVIDQIRNRYALRPLLGWTNKDIYYYMKDNKLPQHPLFFKGFSTVGDWHSSTPETDGKKGRSTRFGGIKEECGLHTED